MTMFEFIALFVAIAALLLAAWSFTIACDALHKPGRPGPQGFTGPMGIPGRECECGCFDKEDDAPKPAPGEHRWGWPE